MDRLKDPLNAQGPVEIHYLTNKLFEIEFGIYDHTNAQNVASDPLAVIRAKPEENLSSTSHLWDLAERFAKARIADRFKLNFLEYIGLPMPDAALLDRLSFEVISKVELEMKKAETEAFENMVNSSSPT